MADGVWGRVFLSVLPLLAACSVHRFEVGSSFASYTKDWSIPAYGPRGAVGDNEPEHDLTLVSRGQRLDRAFRFSVGEGTLQPRPQEKVTVYSTTFALRLERGLGTRWSWDAQAGPRVAWLDNGPGAALDAGLDAATALRVRTGRRSSLGFQGGLWWTPTGNLPSGVHARLGLVLAWDF